MTVGGSGCPRHATTRAFEQKRMRKTRAYSLQVVVEPPRDDRGLERDQHRRSGALCEQAFGIRSPVIRHEQYVAGVDTFVTHAIRGHQSQLVRPRDRVHLEPGRRHGLQRRSYDRDRLRIEDAIPTELGRAGRERRVRKAPSHQPSHGTVEYRGPPEGRLKKFWRDD